MPDYSPRRDLIGATIACLSFIAFAVIGSAIAQSIMEGPLP